MFAKGTFADCAMHYDREKPTGVAQFLAEEVSPGSGKTMENTTGEVAPLYGIPSQGKDNQVFRATLP